MTFSKYELIKAQYDVAEQYDKFHLCLCAYRKCTDHVWHAFVSLPTETDKNLYLFVIPKKLDFTAEQYELFKQFFVRYVKGEKVKEKLEKIKKDFE